MKEYYGLDGKITNNLYKFNLMENFEIFDGPQGNTGEMGFVGQQGYQGIQGKRGNPGDFGDTGDMGPDGYKGNEGEQGEKGSKGIKGDTGMLGLQGRRGEKGIFGPRGEDGFIGEAGDQGPKGRVGYLGDQGEIGDKGETVSAKTIFENQMNGMEGFRMNGFPNYDGSITYIDATGNKVEKKVEVINESLNGHYYRDPKNKGAVLPAIASNYKRNVEAQCPYNGYMNAFVYQIPDLAYKMAQRSYYGNGKSDKEYIVNTGDKYIRPPEDAGHQEARMNPGMPYAYQTDCKVLRRDP